MSCSVIAVPIALSWVVHMLVAGSVVTGGVIGATSMLNKDYDTEKEDVKKYDYIAIENSNFGCDDSHSVTMEHFIEKEFETPFTDKDLLVKTLEEHGVTDISASENFVSGKVEGYVLSFNKYEGKESYTLRISSNNESKIIEKVEDLTSEYTLNVQEDAYLHIIEKLKENNMQIEEEVVEDDNTIVLTINLD